MAYEHEITALMLVNVNKEPWANVMAQNFEPVGFWVVKTREQLGRHEAGMQTLRSWTLGLMELGSLYCTFGRDEYSTKPWRGNVLHLNLNERDAST